MPLPFTPLLRRGALALLLAAALLPVAARADAGLPIVRPDQAGLSPDRLTRVSDWLRAEVAAQRVPGGVILVMRGGKVAYLDAVGQRDPARAGAMKVDDLFRIYSMTKPIVSVAAMMLVEEGKLVLEAPVARYIPAFASVKVGVEKTDAQGRKVLDLVPPARPMTVHDLLRHTAGLTYGFFGEGLVKQMYRDNAINAGGPISSAEFAERIAKMPLVAHPGTMWDYSNATDVLGRVIEVVSGQTLGQHLKARLFDPLGMKDTGFVVAEPDRQGRIAEPLPGDTITPGAPLFDPRVPQMESGGGGLVSTAHDYARFLALLRNGGTLDGRRYIGPATLSFMTADHLSPAVLRTPLYLPGPGYGFGLGFAVRTREGEAPYPAQPGEFYWGGAGGTYMWVDPALDLAVVFMMQSPRQRTAYRSVLRNMINAAVTDLRPAPAR